MFMKYSILILVLFGFFQSCSNDNVKSKLDEIYSEATLIQCDLSHLRDSITAKWDGVNETLNKNLPSEIPSAERSNILKVRNASLIRMFETYHLLDDSTKQTVDKAEKTDQAIALKISTHKKRLQFLEIERQSLLHQIAKSNENLNFENYPVLSDIKPINCNKN